MHLARIRFLLFSILLVGVLFLILFIFLNVNLDPKLLYNDFLAYYVGSQIILECGGGNLYDLETQTAYIRSFQQDFFESDYPLFKDVLSLLVYKNVPVTALIYIPFLLLGANIFQSYLIFLGVSFLIYVFMIFKLQRKIASPLGNVLFFLFVLFLLHALFASLFNGQMSVILFLILYLIFYAEVPPTLRGFLAGLLFLKPQFLIIFPFILITEKNQRNILVGFSLSITLLLCMSVFISGPLFLKSFANFIITTSSTFYGSHMDRMFTFYGVLERFGFSSTFGFLSNLFGYMSLLLLVYWKRSQIPSDKMRAISLLMLPIFGIHLWLHDIIVFALIGPLLLKGPVTFFNILILVLLAIFPLIFIFFGNLFALIILLFSLVLLLGKSTFSLGASNK